MRILLLHNYYQNAGGEDSVFAMESSLLQKCGHQVVEVTANNRDIGEDGRLKLAFNAVWSSRWRDRITELLNEQTFDVAHVHNFFPLISPSIYSAFNSANTPVVQTLHNYRTICPSAMLLRNGSPCHDCIGKTIAWPGVVHGCYRGSRTGSAAVATMLAVHSHIGTWEKRVDRFVALTEFARTRFIDGGLPATKISVKPNFVDPDPGFGELRHRQGALFVGRLSHEKGLRTLIEAWDSLRHLSLTIVGDGPEREHLEGMVRSKKLEGSVSFLGSASRPRMLEALQTAQYSILPSECYEGFPLVLAEAFACGTPVIASRLGAMAEIVDHGRTGLLFEAGNPADLVSRVRYASENTVLMRQLGAQGRAEYEKKYTANANYESLIHIYELAQRERAMTR